MASFKELQSQHGGSCEIVIVSLPPNQGYPSLIDHYESEGLQFVSYQDFRHQDFMNFDIIIMNSWNFPKYRKFARVNRKACVIMTMDNQYLHTLKQQFFLASRIGAIYIRSIVDFVYVGGPRQERYAKLLGFPASRIKLGVYAYDSDLFQDQSPATRQKQFLFVGRKIPEKGLDTLLSSYEIYRILCEENDLEPWELVLAGPGNLERTVNGTSEYGYLTPIDTADLMKRSTCLILPSKSEPYGVVLLEAAATGSLIIATDRVGAVEQTIKEGVNGYVVPSSSPRLMAEAMLKTTQLNSRQIEAGRAESTQRAEFFTPKAWAQRVLEMQSLHQN